MRRDSLRRRIRATALVASTATLAFSAGFAPPQQAKLTRAGAKLTY